MPSVVILGTRGYPSFYGGFETAVRHLSPFLAERGWDVSVFCRPTVRKAERVDTDPRVEQVFTKGIDVKALSTLSYGFTSAISSLQRRPDVALIMNCANGYWLPLLKARNIPSAVNVDGIEWDRAKWGRAAKAVFRGGAHMTARWASELIFDAYAIRDYWRDTFNRSGHVIAYGGEVPPSELILPESVRPGKFVLFVARLVPENSVIEFLDAMQFLPADIPVVIVGSAGYGDPIEERIRRICQTRPATTWLGHVSDDQLLHSLWANAAVYFHGHSVGGTNPALVQAMACGAPTVARDTVYNREVLANAGIFVRPYAPQIAHAIQHLTENPEEQSRLRGLATTRAAANYTWDTICRQYDALLQAMVGAYRKRLE